MRKLLFYSGLYGGSTIALKVAGFLLTVWLAKVFSQEEYAIFGLMYALQTGVSTFAITGLFESVVGLLNGKSESSVATLYNSTIISFFLLATFVGLISFILLHFFSSTTYSLGLQTAVIFSGVILSFASLKAQLFRLQERHVDSLAFSFLIPLGGVIGSFVIIFFDKSISSFFIGSILGSCFPLLFFLIKEGKPDTAIHSRDIKNIFIRISPFVLVTFFGWLSGYGNNFIVDFFLDLKTVARFTFALTIAAIMQMVASALNQVWAPKFYKDIHREPLHSVEKENKKFAFISCLLLGLVGFFILVLFPFGISIIGGNLASYQDLGVKLFVLLLAYLVLVIWTYCYNYLLAYDKGKIVMNITLFTSAIGIPLWVLLISQLGEIGIYLGFLLQMFLRSSVIYYVSIKYWRIAFSWLGLLVGVGLLCLGLLISNQLVFST